MSYYIQRLNFPNLVVTTMKSEVLKDSLAMTYGLRNLSSFEGNMHVFFLIFLNDSIHVHIIILKR